MSGDELDELGDKLLAAWGVTREEIERIDRHGGYALARERARLEREAIQTEAVRVYESLGFTIEKLL